MDNKKFMLDISKKLYLKLQNLSKEEGRSINAEVRKLLECAIYIKTTMLDTWQKYEKENKTYNNYIENLVPTLINTNENHFDKQ